MYGWFSRKHIKFLPNATKHKMSSEVLLNHQNYSTAQIIVEGTLSDYHTQCHVHNSMSMHLNNLDITATLTGKNLSSKTRRFRKTVWFSKQSVFPRKKVNGSVLHILAG